MRKVPVLGLLGGIGSGKSTVAAILARLGAVVLDADRHAGELLLDPQVQKELKEAFGEEIFFKNSRLNRADLAKRVFSCEEERSKLNAILHPRIRAGIRKKFADLKTRAPEKVIVLDIPLLLESELKALCDLLVMIKAPEASRLARVKATRGWDDQELKRREACQAPLEAKEEAAALTIENNGSIEDLTREVESLYACISKEN